MNLIRNLKLKHKVILLALLPVIAMCVVAIVINNTVITDKLLDDTKTELRATAKAVVSAYDQNTGDYFMNDNGSLWKDSYNVSLSETFIDDLADKTGMAVTFFYQDQRLVTSLKDKDGKRITGSKAGDFLKENVLEDGNEVFTNRVSVDGTMYYGYYVPVFQNNSDEVIGMVFAGIPVSTVEKSLDKITRWFVIAIIVILILTILVCTIVAANISSGIHGSMDVVAKIAEGKLNVEDNEKDLVRKDEVGELSRSTKALKESLAAVIGSISENTMTLNASSQEMNVVSAEASDAMDTINSNLEQIVEGAKAQSDSTKSVTESVQNMNGMLQSTMTDVDMLKASTDQMHTSSDAVDKQLQELKAANDGVLAAIRQIEEQTRNTDGSVDRIKKSVNMISEIADQTNLLSLNASIEAARAGESGRGFAVVAQEISQLAQQSAQASVEIEEMVKALNYNSTQSVETMVTVQSAINEQSDNVDSTRRVFDQVKENIENVASGVESIRTATKNLGEETEAITSEIEALDSIATENEERANETMASGNNVLQIVSNVSQMSTEVSNSANEMAEAVTVFEI